MYIKILIKFTLYIILNRVPFLFIFLKRLIILRESTWAGGGTEGETLPAYSLPSTEPHMRLILWTMRSWSKLKPRVRRLTVPPRHPNRKVFKYHVYQSFPYVLCVFSLWKMLFYSSILKISLYFLKNFFHIAFSWPNFSFDNGIG